MDAGASRTSRQGKRIFPAAGCFECVPTRDALGEIRSLRDHADQAPENADPRRGESRPDAPSLLAAAGVDLAFGADSWVEEPDPLLDRSALVILAFLDEQRGDHGRMEGALEEIRTEGHAGQYTP